MRTHLCDLLNVEVPIIQAPMGGASCPALAAAVSNAGALGMLALSWSSPEAVRQQIRETKAQTDRPFGANLVLEWSQHERLAICLEEGVPVVSFFWGDPAPLIQRVHDAGSVVLSTVASAHDARKAVEAGVDAVVAQGWEAGQARACGHFTFDTNCRESRRSKARCGCRWDRRWQGSSGCLGPRRFRSMDRNALSREPRGRSPFSLP